MLRGTIKKLVRDRGFGFITTGPSSKDIFFHVSIVEAVPFDSLEEGQSVEFEMADGVEDRGKGPRAAVVRVVV